MERVAKLPPDWRGSANDLADVVGCGRTTVYAHVRAGRLEPSMTRGNRRYFGKSDVLGYLSWYLGSDRVVGA